jgi:hypothetical protein
MKEAPSEYGQGRLQNLSNCFMFMPLIGFKRFSEI